ncbi:50S ribosomal protein L25/general stress protein Ctc [Mesobacillus harenae]|uniref:50S ribosomal protein L25/general stress protein Ctc n=1 Tax=Mesobacillus harenae TaxID=2213203 RepID=UPI0015807582|nr:50S ribosomal protein L25/general stress protein Ctc [Mesobacillus harenae]
MSAVLKASERKELRKSSLRNIREEGQIPAVVYGNNSESTPVSVDSIEFIKVIRETGRNGVIVLDLNGKKQNVVLGDYQEDPIKREVLHADFLAINMSSKMNAKVRLVLTGEAAGVKDGGVLQNPVHELSITATPDNIPSTIDLDVSNLQVGETLLVSDLKTDASYEINEDDDTVIASILPPRQEEEISTGEEQEPGIPENEEGRETEASEK